MANHISDKITEALSDFTHCIQLDNNNSGCYTGRGNVNFSKTKYVAALDDFNKAIKKDGQGSHYFDRGLSYKNLKNKRKACKDFRKSHQLGYSEAQTQLDNYCK